MIFILVIIINVTRSGKRYNSVQIMNPVALNLVNLYLYRREKLCIASLNSIKAWHVQREA